MNEVAAGLVILSLYPCRYVMGWDDGSIGVAVERALVTRDHRLALELLGWEWSTVEMDIHHAQWMSDAQRNRH